MKLYNLQNENIPNNLFVCRRGIDYSLIDTSANKDNRIQDFSIFFNLIEAGNIPIFLIEYINMNIFKIEYELEKIRSQNFRDYPSRLSSTFASEKVLFNTYVHTFSRAPNCKIIKCDMQIINFLRSNPAYLVEKDILSGYWQGKSLQTILGQQYAPPLWEYLIEGEHVFTPVNN